MERNFGMIRAHSTMDSKESVPCSSLPRLPLLAPNWLVWPLPRLYLPRPTSLLMEGKSPQDFATSYQAGHMASYYLLSRVAHRCRMHCSLHRSSTFEWGVLDRYQGVTIRK